MKKWINSILVVVLLLSVPFPASALEFKVLKQYCMEYEKSVGYYSSKSENLGSETYWKKQIEENKWTGANRPEPLMGDANIDGRVDAKDALFALNFAVNSNVQTATVAYGSRTPYQMQWSSSFGSAYKNGSLSSFADSKRHWLTYCTYNSPFFADVTKDCVVNSLDALQILKYSVGKAKNFPVGQFNSLTSRFSYYPWYTEYTPGYFDSDNRYIDMTNEEFCEKYRFELDVTPTDS